MAERGLDFYLLLTLAKLSETDEEVGPGHLTVTAKSTFDGVALNVAQQNKSVSTVGDEVSSDEWNEGMRKNPLGLWTHLENFDARSSKLTISSSFFICWMSPRIRFFSTSWRCDINVVFERLGGGSEE
jgi:hypothetical protein